MNLIKYLIALVTLTLLSACGGGGGNPGSPSGGSAVTPMFTTAPSTLTLASGTTSASYNVNGGASPYTANSDMPSLISVSLNDSTFTIAAMAGASGSGTVTIVDVKGTKVTIAVTVPGASALFSTAPANLTLAIGASSGPYAVTGGMAPYTVVSDNPALVTASIPTGSSMLSIQALAGTSGGSASIIVSDASGSRLTIPVTVPGPSALFSAAPANLTLAIGASSGPYAVTGGMAPYTVVSDNPALVTASIPTGSNMLSIQALAGTSGGSASIIVSDASGSRLTIAVTVATSRALFVDAPSNLTLAAGAVGNTYTISGGLAPYSAVSSNPAVATSTVPAANGRFVITGVSTGNAVVTIKDATGTTLTVSVTVPTATALFSTAGATLKILSGTTNYYQIFGGTAPYAVSDTSNGVVAKAALVAVNTDRFYIKANAIGTDTVVISDAKGAVITIDITVTQGLYTDAPANLTLAINTGIETYSIFGGVPFSGAPFYRVHSSNPAAVSASVAGSTLSISGLASGVSSLVISDSVGATTTVTVTVPAAGALMSTAPSSLKLATGTSGSYAISGGTGPYTATSANPAIVSASTSGSSLTIGAVAKTVGGTANVVITDSVGTAPLTISVTSAPVQFFTTAPSTLSIAAGASKVFAVFGGTLPYSVVNTYPAIAAGVISGLDGTTLTITGTVAGSGSVIVSDAKGVSVTIAVVVNAAGPMSLSAPSSVFIARNTSNTYDIIGGIPPYLASSSNLSVIQAAIVDASGTVNPYGSRVRVNAVGGGSATFAVTDSAGTQVSVSVLTETVVTPPPPVAFFVSAPTTITMAAGTMAGYAVGGGTAPYSASSSDIRVATVTASSNSISITAVATGGPATLFISDAVGASKTITVTVP